MNEFNYQSLGFALMIKCLHIVQNRCKCCQQLLCNLVGLSQETHGDGGPASLCTLSPGIVAQS